MEHLDESDDIFAGYDFTHKEYGSATTVDGLRQYMLEFSNGDKGNNRDLIEFVALQEAESMENGWRIRPHVVAKMLVEGVKPIEDVQYVQKWLDTEFAKASNLEVSNLYLLSSVAQYCGDVKKSREIANQAIDIEEEIEYQKKLSMAPAVEFYEGDKVSLDHITVGVVVEVNGSVYDDSLQNVWVMTTPDNVIAKYHRLVVTKS